MDLSFITAARVSKTALHITCSCHLLTNTDPSEPGHYAFLKYYFTMPSVNIDHVNHISISYSQETGMAVSFSSQDAFQRALDNWSISNGLILISYAAGCGEQSNGERCYFNVTNLEVEHRERRIVAAGILVHPDQITSLGETEWGWWSAGSKEQSIGSQRPAPSAAQSLVNDSSLSNKWSLKQPSCTVVADEAYGLPTACLGSSFDEMLDHNLGHHSMEAHDEDFLKRIMSGDAVGLISYNSSLWSGVRKTHRRFQSRAQPGFWSRIGIFLLEIAVQAVYDAPSSAVAIGGGINHAFNFTIPDPDAPLGATSTQLGATVARVDDSPWGKAILLKSFDWQSESKSLSKNLKVYCVGCSASGSATVAGRAKWSPHAGLEEGHVEVRVNMHMDLNIGIEAHATLHKDIHTDLFNYGLPCLSYGVVTIGPYISLGARAGLEGTAKGKILAGAKLGMQDSVAAIDLIDPSRNTRSGWEPFVKPALEIHGEVSLSAELGLPVGIKCGMKIAGWEKGVGMVNEPSIKATARVSGDAGLSKSTKLTGAIADQGGCVGIMTEIDWRNQLRIGHGDAGDMTVLDTKDRAIFRKCIGYGRLTPRLGKKRSSSLTIVHSTQTNSTARPAQGTSLRRSRMARATRPGQGAVNSRGGYLGPAYKLSISNTLIGKPSQLVNPAASTRVVSCADGNMYAVRNDNNETAICSGTWDTAPRSEVVYDEARRFMHYYSNTMSKAGISRLRVSRSSRVPQRSVAVALIPVQDPGSPSYYVAVNRKREVFYPVVCDYADGSASRMFLADHPARGMRVLRSEDVVHSITGGLVSRCHLMALKA